MLQTKHFVGAYFVDSTCSTYKEATLTQPGPSMPPPNSKWSCKVTVQVLMKWLPKRIRIQHCSWLHNLEGVSRYLQLQEYLSDWVPYWVSTEIVPFLRQRHQGNFCEQELYLVFTLERSIHPCSITKCDTISCFTSTYSSRKSCGDILAKVLDKKCPVIWREQVLTTNFQCHFVRHC